LVREVSGENADARRREDDSPPPQLVDPKQMVCDRGVPVPFCNHEPGAAVCAISMTF